jgi:hypothetical protein
MGTNVTVDRLTPLDRMMLGVSHTWPQDIGAIATLDGETLVDSSGGLRIDAIRETIASHRGRRSPSSVPGSRRAGP